MPFVEGSENGYDDLLLIGMEASCCGAVPGSGWKPGRWVRRLAMRATLSEDIWNDVVGLARVPDELHARLVVWAEASAAALAQCHGAGADSTSKR